MVIPHERLEYVEEGRRVYPTANATRDNALQ